MHEDKREAVEEKGYSSDLGFPGGYNFCDDVNDCPHNQRREAMSHKCQVSISCFHFFQDVL